MTVDIDQISYISLIVLNVLCVLVSTVFIILYFRLPEKTYGLNIIFILNLSYLANAIFSLCAQFLVHGEANRAITFLALTRFFTNFSLFWSATFAFFTYSVITSKTLFKFKKFIYSSLVMCLALATVYPLTIYFATWNLSVEFEDGSENTFYFKMQLRATFERITYTFVNDFIGTLLPILVTSFYYLRVYQVMRKLNRSFGAFVNYDKGEFFRVFCYFVIPLICFTPSIIASILQVYYNTGNAVLSIIASVLKRVWAILNLLAFWHLNPPSSDRRDSIETPDELLIDSKDGSRYSKGPGSIKSLSGSERNFEL